MAYSRLKNEDSEYCLDLSWRMRTPSNRQWLDSNFWWIYIFRLKIKRLFYLWSFNEWNWIDCSKDMYCEQLLPKTTKTRSWWKTLLCRDEYIRSSCVRREEERMEHLLQESDWMVIKLFFSLQFGVIVHLFDLLNVKFLCICSFKFQTWSKSVVFNCKFLRSAEHFLWNFKSVEFFFLLFRYHSRCQFFNKLFIIYKFLIV